VVGDTDEAGAFVYESFHALPHLKSQTRCQERKESYGLVVHGIAAGGISHWPVDEPEVKIVQLQLVQSLTQTELFSSMSIDVRISHAY
jgi:hypothetical protein